MMVSGFFMRQKSPFNPSTRRTNVITVSRIAGCYIAWCLLQALIYGAGFMFPPAETMSCILIPAAVIVNILFACQLTLAHLVYVEPVLARRPVFRSLLIIVCLALGTGLLFWAQGRGSTFFIQTLSTANLLVLACLTGPWLTVSLKRPSEIVLLAALVLAIDGISVLAGPTRTISTVLKPFYKGGMKGPVPLSDALIVKAAVPGLPQAIPVFGVSDWIMLVFFAAACARFNIRDNLLGPGLDKLVRRKQPGRPFLPITGAGLIAAVVTAQILGLFLPALPFMALALILYLTICFPETRHMKLREWIIAAALVTATGVVCLLVFHTGG